MLAEFVCILKESKINKDLLIYQFYDYYTHHGMEKSVFACGNFENEEREKKKIVQTAVCVACSKLRSCYNLFQFSEKAFYERNSREI